MTTALATAPTQIPAAVTSTIFTPTQVQEIQKIAHTYIVNNPSVLVEASKKLQEQELAKEADRVNKIKVNIEKYKQDLFNDKAEGRIISGNLKGKIIIAEFTQYQCHHCRNLAPIVDKLLKNNSEVKFITIYWPFFGNDAIYAAKAILAAQKQGKYEQLHQSLLAAKEALTKDKIDAIIKTIPGIDSSKLNAEMKKSGVDKGLKANFTLAQNLGLMGTPTFMIANNTLTKFALVPGGIANIESELQKSMQEVK
jgi:protein-disulfide isomerase